MWLIGARNIDRPKKRADDITFLSGQTKMQANQDAREDLGAGFRIKQDWIRGRHKVRLHYQFYRSGHGLVVAVFNNPQISV